MILPDYLNNAVVINQLSSGVPVAGVKSGGFDYSLDDFRLAAGMMPYHYYQQKNSLIPVSSECNSLVFEHAYQNAYISGRSDIVQTIETAKNKLKSFLGYRIGPEYLVKEIEFPRPGNPNFQYAASIGVDGNYLTMNLGEGYTKKIGVETFETAALSADVVYSDEIGDGVNDTATIVYPTLDGEISVDQVRCFVPDDLRTDGSTGPVKEWEIVPRLVKIEGTTLTVIFNSWVMLTPKNKNSFNPTAHDPNNADSFISTMDIYRRYINPNGMDISNSQAILIWDGKPHAFCSSDNAIISSDPAAVGSMIARVGITNQKLGIVHIGASVYNESLSQWSGISWSANSQPDRAIIRFTAGAEYDEKDELVKRSTSWKKLLSIFVAAEIPGHICACAGANKYLDYWSQDVSQIDGNAGVLFRVSEADLANPFGTKRGHIYVWNQVKRHYLARTNRI